MHRRSHARMSRTGANTLSPRSVTGGLGGRYAHAHRPIPATLVLIVFSLSTGSAGAAETVDRLNQYIDACSEHLQFNGSVLVKHEGQTLVSRGVGLANFEHQVPNTPQTVFRIGSITKQFAAMLILQQVQAGKLKLDDPINQYLSDPPDAWGPITIHHLLCHTSGIFNFTNSLDYLTKQSNLGRPDKQVLAMFRDKPLQFAPGEKHEYSNSGYILLGLILEKVTGQKFDAQLKQRIFEPLQMTSSGCDRAAPLVPHRAQGYARQAGKLANALYIDMQGVYAAGAILSTVEDLGRWDQALREHTLLSPELTEKMFTPVLDNYGYGMLRDNVPSRTQYWHNGGINGFHSMFVHCPQSRSCSVVLCNFEDGLPDRMGRELMAILFDEPYGLPRKHVVAKVDPAGYDALVGSYQLAPGAVITITRDEQHLRAQLTGQPKVEIFPESESEFFYKAVDAQATFVRDSQGRVTHLVLHQNGYHQEAKRVSDEVPPERRAVPVDATALEALVGEYELPAVGTLTVTRDKNRLLAQLTGQPKFEIFPESATEFFYKVVDAQITFHKDAAGRVTHLVLHQNGAHLEAQRVHRE